MPDLLNVCNILEEGRFGGPARRIVQVSEKLREFDINTHVVLPKLESDYFKECLSCANVQYSTLDITRLSKEKGIFLRYLRRFLLEIVLLTKFFGKHRFDLVHVNGAYQFKSAIAAKLSATPMIWHLNDSGGNGLMVKALFYPLASVCAKGFIVASKRSSKYYIDNTKLSKKMVEEIHAPVNVLSFKPNSIATGDSKLIVATVANVTPVKGLEYFVQMASLVALKYPDVQFWVAGSVLSSQKKYSEYIFSLIEKSSLTEENFKFFGHVSDIPGFLSQVDICVYSSVREASPTTVWEGMAMGKPVVTTDVGSVNQFIEDFKSGFVVPIRNIEALTEKVCVLLDDSELRLRLGKAARNIAEQDLGLDSAAKKHAEFYRKIIQDINHPVNVE